MLENFDMNTSSESLFCIFFLGEERVQSELLALGTTARSKEGYCPADADARAARQVTGDSQHHLQPPPDQQPGNIFLSFLFLVWYYKLTHSFLNLWRIPVYF